MFWKADNTISLGHLIFDNTLIFQISESFLKSTADFSDFPSHPKNVPFHAYAASQMKISNSELKASSILKLTHSIENT